MRVVGDAPGGNLSSSFHSRRIAVVVSQYPAKPFVATDFPSALSDFITRFDDSVGKALVISLFVIIPDEGFKSPTQRLLAEKDHSQQEHFFETSKIPFQIGIQIETS